MTSSIQSLLDTYNTLTGSVARYGVYERAAFDWFKAGFTLDDFKLVIGYLKRENQRNDYKYSMKLSKLLNDHEHFNDLLNEATAKERNRIKPRTPQQTVVDEFRHTMTTTQPAPALSLKDVMRRMSE